MSFDIEYQRNVCPHCHRGYEESSRNVTYNLARLFAWSFGHDEDADPWGIRWLDGKRGREVVETLRQAVTRLTDETNAAVITPMLPTNGWGTLDGAIATVQWMVKQSEQDPDGEWSVR